MITNRPIHELDQTEWRSEAFNDPNGVILDMRPKNVCNNGIIKGASIIDPSEILKFINAVERLDQSKVYYIYCQNGEISSQMGNVMKVLGFKKIFSLSRGLNRWTGELIAEHSHTQTVLVNSITPQNNPTKKSH